MCGIVGTVGREPGAVSVLIEGLRRLEYRGYDSAGIAVLNQSGGIGGISQRRAEGKLANLEEVLRKDPLDGPVGIGHTRWATHGAPSETNAHPHRCGSVALVHNGIIENHIALREKIQAAGGAVLSETDTELVSHLINERVERGMSLLAAVRDACTELEGAYALAVISEKEPECIVVAKNGGSPIILGVGEGRTYLASDVPAILSHTRSMVFIQDGDFASLTPDGVSICDEAGNEVERPPRQIAWDPISVEKGGYDHFMQKEIFEQPRAITDTIGTRVHEADLDVDLDGIDFSAEAVAKIHRIVLIACGTAWHSCLVAKYMIEQLAGISVEVDLASEFRYRQPVIDENCMVILVSQSGETADTLAGLREGKERGARIFSICNVRESTIARESDDVLYTHAGPEIGVASTKAFTTQVVALYLLALKLGIARGKLSDDEIRTGLHDLVRLPRLVEQTLHMDDEVRRVARKYFHASDFLFLGRGVMFPIALEGALKLKEISYIHAEGYAAGEMKHGPIALIDEDMPVVVVAEKSPVYDKVISNLEEVRTRGGRIIAIATEGDTVIADRAEEVLLIPDLQGPLSAILATIPLQLLAYHVATLKGTDVDQPRNLAKSVTVE